MLTRRSLLLAAMAGTAPALALPERALAFPRDHGAHADFRTEWWYATGRVQSGPREFGFQVTFFRSRVDGTEDMKSSFAARQLVFAHAAITDVQGQRLWHDQRIAREGFGVAGASREDADLRLRDWSLIRTANGYHAHLVARSFSLDLQLRPTQPVLLQGHQGLSRKGPQPAQASYYYSEPQLQTSGSIALDGQSFAVAGTAWLDHEWSEELLDPQAVGWDWIGMNLDDGSALTAFQLRGKSGAALWDGGSFRARPGDTPYVFSRGEAAFRPQRSWTSSLSRASYPVQWLVKTPADFYTVRARVDNQELDSRQSTGAIYWEGLSELIDSNGRRVGQGYLEMTGYASPIRI